MTTEYSTTYLLGRFTFKLDRAADQLLHVHLGTSYKRFIFLTVLQHCGTVTQHELAVALGYSDPAVSTMLVELVKDGYVQTTQSKTHARKRLVTITPEGSAVVAQGRLLLDSHFYQLLEAAGIDIQHYHELTERLYKALIAKMKEEQE